MFFSNFFARFFVFSQNANVNFAFKALQNLPHIQIGNWKCFEFWFWKWDLVHPKPVRFAHSIREIAVTQVSGYLLSSCSTAGTFCKWRSFAFLIMPDCWTQTSWLVSLMIWNSLGDVIKVLFCPSTNIFTWYVRSLGFSESFFMLLWLLDLWTSKYAYIFLKEKANTACLWLSGCCECVCVCHSVSIHEFIENNVYMRIMYYS